MTIHLTPDLEKLLEKDVARGPYGSPDEFVAQAVQMLHDHEQWLAENRIEFASQTEHGFAQTNRGELVDGDDAFRLIREKHERHTQSG